MHHFIYYLLFVSFIACAPSNSQEHKSQQKTVEKNPLFNDYWYSGKAEITSYRLEQSRYGEIHSGEAVLVFVTEPFSKSKQVKLDNWRDTSEDNVSVMKLNMTKKFLTGIYPYSMMMSTFTPVSSDIYPDAFKVTTSLQEWCGHTWMQLNLQSNNYQLSGFSYFESEGDMNASIPNAILEDELWTKLRLNPSTLPVGKLEIVPATFYTRLAHKEVEVKKATATVTRIGKSDYSDAPHQSYSINYEDRSLTIFFEAAFPYPILGWEETYQGLTTKANRINTIQTAYWGKNSNEDRAIREKLGLSTK